MTSSSSNGSLIPSEILETILGSVPAESLKRFKLTCRGWHALLKDKRFIYNHLDLVQEHFIRITNMVQIINPASNAVHSSLPFPNEFQGRDKISNIVHCDGLLLCHFSNSKRLAVWNPCLNQVRWITKPRKSYSFDDFYGIGYDGLSRDNYKILRLYDEHIFEEKPTGKYDPPVEIYELKSNSWKTLDVSLDWFVYSPCAGVSLKGNMYWIAGQQQGIFIQKFDFSTETFKWMSLVPFFDDTYDIYDNIALSAFREDKLSFIHQHVDADQDQLGEIEVWVTNSVKDRVVSWTKLFVVWNPDLPELCLGEVAPHSVYFIDKNNKINVISSEELINNGSKCVCVNLYIIGKDGFQKKEIERHSVEEKWTYKSGYMYLPSLVPIP